MVGLRIKKFLDENGIKYSFVSEKTGVPMNILSPLLNDKKKMSAEQYFLICEAIGVDANTFAVEEHV